VIAKATVAEARQIAAAALADDVPVAVDAVPAIVTGPAVVVMASGVVAIAVVVRSEPKFTLR
jgi:hypothetical protein